MKLYYYLLLGFALGASPLFAIETGTVNRSSYIAGGSQTGCIQASYLDKVLVGASTSGGVLMVHDSSWTTTGTTVISSVTLTLGSVLDFQNTRVKGICYTAATPTNGVTIIYKK